MRGVAPLSAANELQTGVEVRVDDDAARATAALSVLPEREREMVRMAVGYGWSQQKIADEFKMPIGTVKTTLRRVMGELRLVVEGRRSTSEVRA